MATGGNPGPGETACDTDADCRLDSAGCCAACPPVSEDDFEARNSALGPRICVNGAACAPCPDVREQERNTDFFRATCQDRECVVTDITQTDSAACETSDDCFLRDGSDCCPGCDGQGYVPLSSVGFLEESCVIIPCPGCVSPPPANVVTVCHSETKHCVKTEILP
jgi:hypothetical protein